MKIKLGNAKPGPDSSRIEAFEKRLGARLPAEYKKFLMEHNGSRPESNIFRVGDRNGSRVNGFIAFDDLSDERVAIADALPAGVIPIAWDGCGNYVCLDLNVGGTVLFWDHEESEVLTFLASGFGAFCEMLEPFDVSTVKLKPGQVGRVWIDPSFLKELQEKPKEP